MNINFPPIIKNLFSSGWGKISTVLIRLVQVPILISALGVSDYGVWLVISSLPAWLTMANIGFGNVASNEISMLVAAGEDKKANEIFSTTLFLVSIILVIGMALVGGIVPFINWVGFFDLSLERNREVIFTILFLSLSVFISFFFEIFRSRFRAAHKVHQAILISSFRPWLELLLLVLVLMFSSSFQYIALTSLISSIILLVVIGVLSRNVLKSIRFSVDSIKKKHLRFLFTKGAAFQAFPLGNALLFQGSILVIQTILGASAVALFGTARTLVRSVNQMMELINQSVWPELSIAFGKKNYELVRKLHRNSVLASVVLASCGATFLMFFGQGLYSWWTGNALTLNRELLILFLLPIPFNALWFTSSVVHVACNQHEKLGMYYLGAAVLSISACLGFASLWGINGAALSTLVADIILIPFVFRKSLKLTHDTFAQFIDSVLTIVRSIKKWGFGS